LPATVVAGESVLPVAELPGYPTAIACLRGGAMPVTFIALVSSSHYLGMYRTGVSS
jgi:hypothetical protein